MIKIPMDNNLPKNRFFSRSIKLDLILPQISLKQIILKQLQDAIASYRTENSIAKNLDQVLTSLPEKVILQDDSNFPSLVYCCAIAFPLANLCALPSLQVAQELIALLPINIQESTTESPLQFTVRVKKNGLIEFVLGDRSVGLWLSRMGGWGDEMGSLGAQEIGRGGDYNVFPGQYVHDRCCSLLRLGEREGLINLNDGAFSRHIWQIANPNPFQYYCDENINYCYEPAELNLLRKISLLIDYICDRTENELLQECQATNPKIWVQLALNLSDACLKFIAACRIFGSVAREQRGLAIARLGLIAIVQKCLQHVLK